jgi:hypothetical protein
MGKIGCMHAMRTQTHIHIWSQQGAFIWNRYKLEAVRIVEAGGSRQYPRADIRMLLGV